MPFVPVDGGKIYYEEFGEGFPVLAMPQGGHKAEMANWAKSRLRTFDPTVDLVGNFRVITLDQRNVGRSRVMPDRSDGWHSFAADHLVLIDHLGLEQFHLMGACIGCSFALQLCELIPEKIKSAYLQHPVGAAGENKREYVANFRSWTKSFPELGILADRDSLNEIEARLYRDDFVFSVTRRSVSECQVPLLILPGSDPRHPPEIAAEIIQLAPFTELLAQFRKGGILEDSSSTG